MARKAETPTTPPQTPKRVYEPPKVAETGAFERLVLACGHLPGGPPSCNPALGGSANS